MQEMIFTVLSSAAGSAAGCILSLFLGRPGKGAKADPLSKRILPLCAGLLLMALSILIAPGILRLVLAVFFSAFTLTGIGTAIGLEKRDRSLLEMAYVFFISDKARITYIDLPACRDKLVLSAMIAGPVSAAAGAAALFAGGASPSIPLQAAAGILLIALAAGAGILMKKSSGKGGSRA